MIKLLYPPSVQGVLQLNCNLWINDVRLGSYNFIMVPGMGWLL